MIAAYTKVVKSKDLKLSLEIKALFLSQVGLVQVELESEQERINIAQEEINSAQTKLDSAKALLKSANGQVHSFHTQIYAEVV